MIVVTTGVPGSGKTLWDITFVMAKAKKENRAVFYSGIKDLKIPGWTEIDPEKWMDCPANAIVLIDEAQRLFRPRSHGTTVPKYVADLETHRHLGIDLFLITQHPMLIESNVRRLCGLHFHVVRKWGMQASTVHEWPTIKEACDKAGQRDDSVRHAFKYPKANYALYHSAEVHTHKARLPYHLLFIAAVPFAVGYAGWRVYDHWFPTSSSRLAAVGGGAPGAGGGVGNASGGGGNARGGGGDRLTAMQYVAQFQPRVTGLAYTAPVYDEVTKPVVAPYPAACVSSESRCKCYSQQATVLDMPEETCRNFAQNGFFIGWRQEASGGAIPGQVIRPQGMPEKRLDAFPDAPQMAASLSARQVAAMPDAGRPSEEPAAPPAGRGRNLPKGT